MSHTYTPSSTTLHATVTMPDDADNGTAAAQNTPDEAAMDNAAYCAARIGGWRIVQIDGYSDANTYSAGAVGANSAGTFNGTGDLLISNLATTNTVVGDVVEVEITMCINGAVAMQAEWRLAANKNSVGKAEMTGARHYEHNIDANYKSVTIVGRTTVASGEAGTCLVYVQCRSAETVPLNAASFFGPICATARLLRSNA
jgi:hypothetical protein